MAPQTSEAPHTGGWENEQLRKKAHRNTPADSAVNTASFRCKADSRKYHHDPWNNVTASSWLCSTQGMLVHRSAKIDSTSPNAPSGPKLESLTQFRYSWGTSSVCSAAWASMILCSLTDFFFSPPIFFRPPFTFNTRNFSVTSVYQIMSLLRLV